jgi:hypothetical protein
MAVPSVGINHGFIRRYRGFFALNPKTECIGREKDWVLPTLGITGCKLIAHPHLLVWATIEWCLPAWVTFRVGLASERPT